MMKITNDYLVISLFFCVISLSAQIPNGLDTLYGNEWIKDNQSYLRIPINEDGFYRIRVEDIQTQGWPVNSISATDFQLFYEGQLVQLHNSNESSEPLSAGDYLVFYGKKNRGELDKYLYRKPEEQQLNPEYSLISDEASYYLTYESEGGINYNTINNDLSALPSAEPYVWQIVQNVYADYFMKEYYRESGATLYFSHFSIGEGYGNRSINQLLADGSTTQADTLILNNAYTSGPNPILETRYTAALFDHIQRLSVNETELRTDTFYNWKLLNIIETLPSNTLSEGEARTQWKGFGGEKDEVCVGFTKVTYPAIPSAGGSTFFEGLLPANGVRQYLEINDWGSSSAIVYDQTNGLRIVINNIIDGLLQLSLPASTEDRQLIVIASEDNLTSTDVQTVNLNLPNTNNANYIILTNSLLRDNGDPVQAYADYRASIAGGSYRTAVVNIDDLFDQFAYGVQQHPLGVRNFVAWQRKINPDFKYLFIIGKGREYKDMRTAQALEEALGNTLFIPSFGFPASDNLLVSDINLPTPLVSIGRLPAINSGEVALYLNKIRSKEALALNEQTIEARAWMKDVVHLGGGATPSEKQNIKGNLNAMALELERGKFGARVTSFFKTSSDPIQTSVTDQIFDRINKGVSIITFFGHSSAGTFDFNIDNPDNYENAPKYPLLLSLGCYSGNMYAGFRSLGERFIFLENGGAGAFGASRGLGFIHSLNDFARYFYKQMSNDYYGQPIGDGIRATIRNFENFTDNAYGTLMEQFSIQGDPAFRLNPTPGPDFVFDAKKTRFEPSIVNAQKDSFQVSFTLQNIGQAIQDTIELTIKRQLPSGEIINTIVMSIPAPTYDQEITLTLPTEGKLGVGINQFLVTANTNLNHLLPELPNPSAQLNNELISSDGKKGIPFFIIDNNALPIWPPNYALVGDADITLKASTADAFAPERTYFMELDTSPVFSQPLANTTIVQKGGVIRWVPDFTWKDSTVYYWRVTPDSLDIGTPEYVWEGSSFTYINGIEPGWGQGHWGQWKDGDLEHISFNAEEGFNFQNNLINIRIRNKIWDNGDRPGLFNNNGGTAGSVRPWNYLNAGVAVIAYKENDPNGFWRNPPPGNPFQAGDYGVPTGNSRVFAFPTSTEVQRANLMEFLNDVIPDDYFIMLFTVIKQANSNIQSELWAQDSINLGENVFQILEQQGATQIRTLESYGTIPYIFVYRKNQGAITESLNLNIEGEANIVFDLQNKLTYGDYQSPLVGPGWNWGTINWSFDNVQEDDLNTLTLYTGNDINNLDSIKFDTLGMTGSINLNELNLQTKDYSKLKWNSYDDMNRTPSLLNYWHITHQHFPDIAIDPAIFYYQTRDTLVEGEEFQLSTAISNVSDVDLVDSFQVKYTWQNNGEILQQNSVTVAPLGADESQQVETLFDTRMANGNPLLIIDVNPETSPEERTYINNSASLELKLIRDEIAPVVDVRFDGRKILSGEIISSKSLIIVDIKDENLFIPLDDPKLFDVTIKTPFGNEILIDTEGTNVDFSFEFTSEINQAQISFQPELDEEGIYVLQIKGKDSSNNQAGRLNYEIEFEVILTTQLSNILPYPNPFSTNTRFVYTLTGGETVSGVSIQIMTVSGRIVKHISSQELGEFEVGTHLTDYIWDGTDDYGDQLANGVYLYQVLSPPNPSTDELIPVFANDSIDTFFKGGLGKIVLLR